MERQNVQKCMNFQGGGTQTPQLNGSFTSNVRLRLLCFRKEQPPEVFYKRMYCWTSFAKLVGKILCWSLFLIKMQAFRPTTLFKKCSNTSVFLLNISKLLRTPLLKNISERLVLSKKYSKLFLNLYFELWKLSQSKIPFQKLIQIFPLNFCYPPPKFKYWLTNTCLMVSSFLTVTTTIPPAYRTSAYRWNINWGVPSLQGNQYISHMYI